MEADPAAVETARKEAEAAMRDKLDKARAAEKKARDEAVRAANDVSRTERELKQAQAELDALRARAELAEKRRRSPPMRIWRCSGCCLTRPRRSKTR